MGAFRITGRSTMSFREWMERNNVSIKSSKKYSAAIYGAIPRMGLGHVPEGKGIEAFEDFLLRVRADESFRFAVRKRVEHRLSVKAHLFFYSGRGNYLSSCGSEITALDRTILPLFLFRSSSTASSHIEPNASKTIPGRIRKMLWFLPVVPFLFRRWLRRSSALADQDVRRES